jgi:hypothetical protein
MDVGSMANGGWRIAGLRSVTMDRWIDGVTAGWQHRRQALLALVVGRWRNDGLAVLQG